MNKEEERSSWYVKNKRRVKTPPSCRRSLSPKGKKESLQWFYSSLSSLTGIITLRSIDSKETKRAKEVKEAKEAKDPLEGSEGLKLEEMLYEELPLLYSYSHQPLAGYSEDVDPG